MNATTLFICATLVLGVGMTFGSFLSREEGHDYAGDFFGISLVVITGLLLIGRALT